MQQKQVCLLLCVLIWLLGLLLANDESYCSNSPLLVTVQVKFYNPNDTVRPDFASHWFQQKRLQEPEKLFYVERKHSRLGRKKTTIHCRNSPTSHQLDSRWNWPVSGKIQYTLLNNCMVRGCKDEDAGLMTVKQEILFNITICVQQFLASGLPRVESTTLTLHSFPFPPGLLASPHQYFSLGEIWSEWSATTTCPHPTSRAGAWSKAAETRPRTKPPWECKYPKLDRSKAAVLRVEMTHACGGELVYNLLDTVFNSPCPFVSNTTTL